MSRRRKRQQAHKLRHKWFSTHLTSGANTSMYRDHKLDDNVTYVCPHNCRVQSQQTRLRIRKCGILSSGLQAGNCPQDSSTPIHSTYDSCNIRPGTIKTHLMPRSSRSSTYYLSKLILWWCIPPALPRPPGCFLCLPARVNNTPLAQVQRDYSGCVA